MQTVDPIHPSRIRVEFGSSIMVFAKTGSYVVPIYDLDFDATFKYQLHLVEVSTLSVEQGRNVVAQTPPKTGFKAKTGIEKWQDGLERSVRNPEWHAYDGEIRTAVDEINRHLSDTAGYRPLDWQLAKAMLWMETGAEAVEWKTKPMQIGKSNDPGLASLLSGNEGGDLILPPTWKEQITMKSAQTVPVHNIRAGIGYLLMRMANFRHESVLAADAEVYEVTVETGDSLDKIAQAQGSTLEVMEKLNPVSGVLRPGQVLKCRKASIQRVITGWRPIITASIARRYNGNRDPNYVKKLDYALSLVRKEK